MQQRHSGHAVFWVAALFTFLLITACGGGGGGVPATTETGTRHFGEIEALGSIVVNGVRYEVEGAQVIGLDSTLDLQEGMVVKVDGRVDDNTLTGTAEQVEFENRVVGPLEAVTGAGGVQVNTIMGQPVIFEDNLTKFDAATGMPLAGDLNKVFQVSGFEDETGRIQATFARKVGDDFNTFLVQGGTLEVKGSVATLDTTAQTFTINGLTIDYSTAILLDLPAGLADGLLVEIKGDAFDPVTNTLTALDIEGKTIGLGDDSPKGEVEGFIAGLNANGGTFSVNGQLVDFNGAAFRSGIEADLANGVKVEAQGPLANGVLQATRVTFKESVRIEANADTKVGGTLTFAGLPGISVETHADLTRGAEALDTIIAGNQVKVRARQSAGGLMITRLEKTAEEPGDRTIIQGPLTAYNEAANSVTIMNTVEVNTATILNDNFKEHDNIIGKPAFFAGLQAGVVVKARFRNGQWEEIEIQD
jgi:hypothetical protein